MRNQNGSSFQDRAAKSGAPQTRAEVESMFLRTPTTDIVVFTKGWLSLDDEREQMEVQIRHVESVLGDRVLANMLRERSVDIIATMRRRARDLARLLSTEIQDLGCKCYVLKRMIDLAPEDETIQQRLCDSLRSDIQRLGIDVKALPSRVT